MLLFKRFASSLLATLVSASAISQPAAPEEALAKRDGTCSGGPWLAPSLVGSDSAGAAFCETGWSQTPYPIETITIYSTTEAVRGLQFGYTNGMQSPTYGDGAGSGMTASSITVNYAAGELINFAHLFGATAGGGDYLRGLTIRTNKGQQAHGGVDASSGVAETVQAVGAGVLLGVEGRASAGIINEAGLFFLASPVSSIDVTDLQFPQGPTGGQDIAIEDLEEVHYYNAEATNETFSFMNTKTLTTMTTFTQTSTSTYGGSEAIGISGGIPMFITATSTTTFTWMYAQADATAVATTDTITVSWTQGGTLEPDMGVDCTALVGHGMGAFPYTSTVTLQLQDGTQYSFPEDGVLHIDNVSEAEVTCAADNNETPPPGVSSGGTSPGS